MAKYINRENLDFLNDFRIDSGKYNGLRLDEVFDELATADVVERSKIDMAIEEITNLNRYQEGIDTMNVGDDLMISWCKTLDILKEI